MFIKFLFPGKLTTYFNFYLKKLSRYENFFTFPTFLTTSVYFLIMFSIENT